MPVRNEERHLDEAVRAVLSQDYPGELELVLAVGPSQDKTEEISQRIAAADSRVTVVPNPSGRIPNAVNAAIKASRYSVVARVDGHCLLPPGYLCSAVRVLGETGADNVGGIMAAVGVTPFEQAVAWAMTSPFGVGAAPNHTGGQAGPADTVYLGVYRRAAIEQVGGYDEAYQVAEDWEMNHRIRLARGLIWFLPDLQVTYRPRPARRALAALVPVRAVAPGSGQAARGHNQPPLPGPARRAAGGHHRDAGRNRRPGRPGRRSRGQLAADSDRRVRRAAAVPGRPAGSGRPGGARPASRGYAAAPGGARCHAHVLGGGVPHQPGEPGSRQRPLRRLARSAPEQQLGDVQVAWIGDLDVALAPGHGADRTCGR